MSLAVNGVPVFCRGACWTPADLVGLSGERETLAPMVTLAREAGVNMLRVPGITLYEADAFHDLCDEQGILVWQDLMLANFDYPHDDPAFRERLHGEISDFLDRTQTSPSLCIVCGGSEVWQQAAMLGLPRAAWSEGFPADTLPGLFASQRPDVITVPNSPPGAICRSPCGPARRITSASAPICAPSRMPAGLRWALPANASPSPTCLNPKACAGRP